MEAGAPDPAVPMALTRTRLFDGALLSVRHVRCRPTDRAVSDVEHSETDTLVLPGRGVFFKHLSPREQLVAEPTQALLFAAGRPYRISHPDLTGDDCIAIQLSPGVMRDALVSVVGVDTLGAPRLRPQVGLAPAALATRAVLSRRLGAGRVDRLEVEETGLALVSAILASARREPWPPRQRPATRSRCRQQAEAVRAMLMAAPEKKWTLAELARGVYTSPFHLARLFRRETGVSVHQYQMRVRLHAALDRLLETEQRLTTIALELGFATHSHFTASFHRLVGVTPDRLRRCAGAAEVRELRTILIERLRAER